MQLVFRHIYERSHYIYKELAVNNNEANTLYQWWPIRCNWGSSCRHRCGPEGQFIQLLLPAMVSFSWDRCLLTLTACGVRFGIAEQQLSWRPPSMSHAHAQTHARAQTRTYITFNLIRAADSSLILHSIKAWRALHQYWAQSLCWDQRIKTRMQRSKYNS